VSERQLALRNPISPVRGVFQQPDNCRPRSAVQARRVSMSLLPCERSACRVGMHLAAVISFAARQVFGYDFSESGGRGIPARGGLLRPGRELRPVSGWTGPRPRVKADVTAPAGFGDRPAPRPIITVSSAGDGRAAVRNPLGQFRRRGNGCRRQPRPRGRTVRRLLQRPCGQVRRRQEGARGFSRSGGESRPRVPTEA